MTLQQEIAKAVAVLVNQHVPRVLVCPLEDNILVSYATLPDILQILSHIYVHNDHVSFNLKKLHSAQQRHGKFRIEYADPQFPQLIADMLCEVIDEYEKLADHVCPV